MGAEQEYNSLAFRYDLLYSWVDKFQEETRFINLVTPYLPEGDIKILDAACGNGFQATALAAQGYIVHAADISNEMISLTKQNTKSRDLEIETKRSAWKELPKNYEKDSFDALFCWGNSISHCENEAERLASLEAFNHVLAPGGRLFLNFRDWDKALFRKERFTAFPASDYRDQKCIPLYVWNWSNFEEPNSVDLFFTYLEEDNQTQVERFSFTFTPFTKAAMAANMEQAGFEIIGSGEDEGGMYYYIGEKT